MYIGVDLGGTNIVVGLVDEQCNVISTKSRETNSFRGKDPIIKDIIEMIEEIKSESIEDIKAIGVGIPGFADKAGNVKAIINLKWKNVNLSEILEEKFKIPVAIDNDATVAGVAEFEAGAMRGYYNGVLLTLGTGIGAGIIINGQVFNGSHAIGSEIGHMVIGENFYTCNCGRNGCFETFASSTGIIKYAEKLLKEGENSKVINNYINGDYSKLNAKIIIDAAKEGDSLGLKVFNRAIKYLAIGILNIMNIIDPEVIAFGGGVSNAGEFLLEALRVEVERTRYNKDFPVPEFKIAHFKNDAGIIGAAMIGKHKIN